MVDPVTPNLQLYQPPNGADVNTWDVPMNANTNLLDAALGQTATVAVAGANIVLAPAQYQCGTIIFTGIQVGNISVTFPTFGRIYNVLNLCTNNNTFYIALGTAFIGLPTYVCAPPGIMTTVYCDGTNFRYVTLGGPIGSYWDYGGNTVPLWVTTCSVPPYLNCDGTGFNAATYPVLNSILGGAVLPDARGRARYALNQGTGRSTAIPCNVLLAGGGTEFIGVANLPNYALPVTDPGHFHVYVKIASAFPAAAAGADTGSVVGAGNFNTTVDVTNISVASGGGGAAYAPPGYCGGLTLIRAA